MNSLWQQLYDSPWQQPRGLVVLGLVALALVGPWALGAGRARSPFLAGWLLVCGVVSVVDAVLTANDSPLLPGARGLYKALAIAFVIVGDARFYALLERYTRDPAPVTEKRSEWARASAMGLAWATLTSLIIVPFTQWVPSYQSNPRLVFLTYECVAFVQALVWLRVIIPRRMARLSTPAPEATVRWLREVTGFVLVQYALWPLSDVIILWVSPAGFLLRVAPNVLYYGLFVAFVYARAPGAVRGLDSSAR